MLAVKRRNCAEHLFPVSPVRVSRLFFALGAAGGLLGLALSFLIRLELQAPGVQYFATGPLFNVVVAAHGRAMNAFCLFPLLFAGFAVLIVPRGLGVERLAWWPLAPLAAWLLGCAFVLFGVVLGWSAIEAVGPRAAMVGAGWNIFAPRPPGFSVGVVIGLLAVFSWAIAYAAMTLTAVAVLATMATSVREWRPLRQSPPATWALAAAASIAVVLLPIAAYCDIRAWLEVLDPDFASRLFSPMRQPAVRVQIDPFPAIALVAGIGVASRAMEVAAGRRAVAPAVEVIIMAVVAALACAKAVLPLFWIAPFEIAEYALSTGVAGNTPLLLLALFSLWAGGLVAGQDRQWVPALWTAGAAVLMLLGFLAYRLYAAQGADRALHNTYYVVALQHSTAVMASLFVAVAGWLALFGDITGRRYSALHAAFPAALVIGGTFVTFVPQFMLGMMGMPRQYMDYPNAFATYNAIASYGAFAVLAGIADFAVVMARSRVIPEDTTLEKRVRPGF